MTHGFTLLEILVVMIIIAIVATFAALTFGDFGEQRRVTGTAKHIALIIPIAQQQAMLQPAVLRLVFKDKGYEFYRYTIDKEKRTRGWQPLSKDEVLGFQAIPKDVTVSLQVFDQDSSEPSLDINNQTVQPKLIMLPSGYLTPFKIDVGPKGKPARFQIIGAANGNVKLINLKKTK